MKHLHGRISGGLAAAALAVSAFAGSAAAQKTLLMHYMPWFVAPDTRGFWGGHWTGWGSHNPDNFVGPDNRRDIYSHYYPLIEPYDSANPDVVECQLLQMKLAGVDGVIADWYGISGAADYGEIQTATLVLFSQCQRLGMQFAVMFEDRTIEYRVNTGQLSGGQVVNDLRSMLLWMQTNWFSDPVYVQRNGRPLLANFGPLYVTSASTWDSAFSVLQTEPSFYCLPHLWQGAGADGGFNWVKFDILDNNPSEAVVKARIVNYWNYTSANPAQVIPGAVSGFHDDYNPPGQYAYLDHRDGLTLRSHLEAFFDGPWDTCQLITFNDYTEGTMIEPTREFGYTFLEVIQEERAQASGGSFTLTPDDLLLPAQLLDLRRQGQTDPQLLDAIALLLAAGNVDGARAAMSGAFVTDPADSLVEAGGVLSFSAQALVTPDALQWTRDNVPLADGGSVSGATTENLTISPASIDDAGQYRLVLTLSGSDYTSAPAIGGVRKSPLGDADFNNDGAVNDLDVFDFIDLFEFVSP